jgi:hypothetical protein
MAAGCPFPGPRYFQRVVRFDRTPIMTYKSNFIRSKGMLQIATMPSMISWLMYVVTGYKP